MGRDIWWGTKKVLENMRATQRTRTTHLHWHGHFARQSAHLPQPRHTRRRHSDLHLGVRIKGPFATALVCENKKNKKLHPSSKNSVLPSVRRSCLDATDQCCTKNGPKTQEVLPAIKQQQTRDVAEDKIFA
jgi:hypothetical protein